jgi:hypothetical protein
MISSKFIINNILRAYLNIFRLIFIKTKKYDFRRPKRKQGFGS